ncbi:MAG: hypothetical protein RIT10_266 [Bacteroidota bacterium]|jgi:hypothetical protein
MKVSMIIVALMVSFSVFSQSNFTVFNNNGQAFYVILNGIKQNSIPQTNVYVSGLKNGAYSTKLIFADGKTADIDKNFFIDAPSDITTRILFKKGKGKLQLLSIEPTHGALQQTGVVYYRQDNYAVYSDAPVTTQIVTSTPPVQSNQTNLQVSGNQQQNTMNTNGQINGNVNVNMNLGLNAGITTNSSTTTTTTTTQSTSENINLNVGMNVNGGGITTQTQTENINMNVGMNVNGGGLTTQTQTENVNMNVGMNGINTTTQNSATNVNVGVNTSGVSTSIQPPNGNVNITVNGTGTNTTYDNNQNYSYNQSNQVNQQISTNSNSSSSVICTKTFTDLQDYLADLKSITFEEDKVETIKKDFVATCLMANQAVEIVKTLTFEANRFEVATYLYDRMFDKNNGRLLTPLFTFEATKNDYRDYMRK